MQEENIDDSLFQRNLVAQRVQQMQDTAQEYLAESTRNQNMGNDLIANTFQVASLSIDRFLTSLNYDDDDPVGLVANQLPRFNLEYCLVLLRRVGLQIEREFDVIIVTRI